MAHKGHPKCDYSSIAACERARQELLGRCRALTKDAGECGKWATDEAGYCAQHFEAVRNAELRADRAAVRKAKLDAGIERFLAWTKDHPSVWDVMPLHTSVGSLPLQNSRDTEPTGVKCPGPITVVVHERSKHRSNEPCTDPDDATPWCEATG